MHDAGGTVIVGTGARRSFGGVVGSTNTTPSLPMMASSSLWIVLLAFPLSLGAQSSDVIRGHVRTTAGAPLVGAVVTVTSADRAAIPPIRTDSAGGHAISIGKRVGPLEVGWRAPTVERCSS